MSRADPGSTGTPVDRAISDLVRLRSSDPAARHAMHAIELTRLTLETFGAEKHRPPGGSNEAEAGADRESSESPRW